MHFHSQEVIQEEQLIEHGQFDIAFFGDSELDDRCTRSSKLVTNTARKALKVDYDPEGFKIQIGEIWFRSDDLMDVPLQHPARRIVIDTTSLEFPELILLIHAYRDYSTNGAPEITFIYVEPQEYVKKASQAGEADSFELSDGFMERRPIPGFAHSISASQQAHLVSFLGFEGSRALRVLQDDDGNHFKEVTVVFGVPPFQSSWDIHSLLANSALIKHSSPSICFCGANDPLGAYLLLEKIANGLPGSGCNRLAVAPFGTKPTALGVALFCVERSVMRVIFDYPVKKKGRTRGVHCIHRYIVKWS